MASLAGKALVFSVMMTITAVTLVGAQSNPPTDADCKNTNPFADPANCTAYYQCFDIGGGELVVVHLDCPTGGYWDAENNACVVGTCENPTTTTEATTEATTEETTSSSDSSTDSSSESTSEGASSTSESSTEESTTEESTTIGSSTEESTTEMSSTSSSEKPTTTAEPSTPDTEMPPTIGPPTFVCTATGFFAHPTDPAQYYQCVLIGAQFYYYVYSCPALACFQEAAGTCVMGSCPTSNTTAPTTKPTTTAGPGPSGPTDPPAVTTTTPAPVNITCDSVGQFPYPGSCTKYYHCVIYQGNFLYAVFQCPPGTFFNPANRLCTFGTCPTTAAPTDAPPDASTDSQPSTDAGASTPPAVEYPCPNEGFFPDPVSCQGYYQCVLITGQMFRYSYLCPPGSYWNSATNQCTMGACPSTQGPTSTTGASASSSSTTGMTTEVSTSSDSSERTSVTTPPPFSCTQEGIFTDPLSCMSYNRCIMILGRLYYFTYTCPPNTKFDLTLQLCVVGSC